MGSGLPKLRLSIVATVAAVVFGLYKARTWRPDVPLKSYEWHYEDDVLPDSVLQRMIKRVEEAGKYRTALDDVTSKYEHIGERRPINDSACNHHLLVATPDGKHCQLPQRLDVGRHHMLTGGRTGAKERTESLVPRLSTFLTYMFDAYDDPELRKHLFESPRYLEAARAVCRGREYFDPVQLNMVVMLPGQELAMHFDSPWMWGANRFTHPQWLLVAAANSGLYADRDVPQIQGLVWLHQDGSVNNSANGGQFYFYPDGPAGTMVEVNSKYNSMLVVDGCKVIHGVTRFRPERDVPMLSQRKSNELRHVGGGRWELVADGTVVGEYRTEELRISLVWRARCFRDADEAAEWKRQAAAGEAVPLDEMLDALEADLRRRGHLGEKEPRPEPVAFADLLMRVYAPYPLANLDRTLIPYNYCALENIAPAWLKQTVRTVLSPLCG